MDTQPDRRALLKNALTAIDTLQAKLNAVEQAKKEPIAIVGMGCRFPGGANSPAAYWQLLADGVDTIRQSPPDRWDQSIAGDTAVSWYGSFLDGIDQFDPQFFGITPREAATMDPQQRLVLEVTWEALEHAGIAPDSLRGSQTGIYVGITTNDYAHISLKGDPTELDVYTATGSALNVNPGRVAFTLGLQGPSMAIDTACSSSLVAIHLACASLRAGETNMALAGGVNALLKPEAFISFSRWGMMAPDGRCKTFDARADGFVRGEGCGMIVLKRLSDAQADGDNILAVIRGSAVNQDGRSSGLTVPNGLAQRAVISQALASAGIKPAEIGYVEAHGTGTTLGDPIEVEAIGGALRAGRTAETPPLFLSSVKTNIGHLESASGIAGLMKVVLSLQHQAIPGHLHLQERSPQIPWPAFPIEIPTAVTPWPALNNQRLAGVSSFGFSGTNAHIILGQAPELAAVAKPEVVRPFHLLTLSARNEGALKDMAHRFADHLADAPETAAADITLTASTGRAHFSHRLAVVGRSLAQQAEQLAAFATGQETEGVQNNVAPSATPQIAFLFTGQGAQYVQMGQRLMQTEPVFRQTMEECDAILRPFLHRSLLEIIYPPDDAPETAALIDQTQYTQPALFAVEYALARLWRSWGIKPVAVMGHSVGEFVAACVAGLFSLEDGLKLIAARGRLMGSLPAGGAMAAVFADEATVQQAIAAYRDQVSIAAINGPGSVVISGAGTAVATLIDQLAAQKIKARPLTVSHAFHSPLMDPILDEFAAVAASVTFAEPHLVLVSNVSGKVAGAEVQTAVYWRDHVRQPVRFADAMQTLAEAGVNLFLECGPQPTLSGMGHRCLPEGAATFVPSLRPNQDDAEQMVRSLGQLYINGANVDWSAFHTSGGRRVALPTYPFQRQRYWVALPKAPRLVPQNVLHPLLHEPLSSPLLDDTVYVSRLAVDAPAYLTDHRVFDLPLFPGTGYLEVALAAARLALHSDQVVLANVQIQEAMILPEAGERLVQTAVSPPQNGQSTVRIFSQDENGKWQQHSTAVAHLKSAPLAEPEPLAAIQTRCAERIEGVDYYRLLRDIGLGYGPAFRGIRAIQRRDGEALAEVTLPDDVSGKGYLIHPALLDACFQVIGAALPGLNEGASANVYVPVGVSHFQLVRPGVTDLRCHAVVESGSGTAEALSGQVRLLDPAGQLVALLDGIQLRRVSRMALQQVAKRPFADLIYRVNWQPTGLPQAAASLAGHWLILSDGPVGQPLAEQVQQRGGTTTVAAPNGFDMLVPSAYERLLDEATEQGKRPLQGVIHLWGLLPHDEATTAQQWGYGSALLLTQALLRRSDVPRLWLATQGAQAVLADGRELVQPNQAALWGFARTLAVEEPALRPVIVDLDPAQGATGVAAAILAELSAGDGEDQVAWRGDGRLAARLHKYQPDAGQLPIPEDEPFELFTPQQGILDNITVRPRAIAAPGAGEVALKIVASGLNFRDVLNALGMYPGPAGLLGNECVGVVTAVGQNVHHVQVGDTVMALGDGTFASHLVTRAEFVAPIPANLTPAQAATVPITFLTAFYGLHHLARIQPGDRILIHAAAGGVGMAAVQLAQQVGAEIFGTAGSPEKRALLKSLGVPHVMNSRTLEFADEIMALTNGEGVDIVLNALADEFIDKSFAVLADNGRFLEMGKRGIWHHEQVAALNPTLAYFPYDLADVARETPQLIGEMMQKLSAQFESGALRPLPLRTFPIAQAIDAFRFMSQAKHVGKIVLDQQAAAAVRPDGTYLVTGGLGGLGLATARGLAGQGARHLVLLGRSKPSAAAEAELAHLRADGVTVLTAKADVAVAAEVQRVLDQIAAELPPLRGIIHAAGVLADGRLTNQSWAQFATVMAPKILGTQHLDRLTRGLPLDFFVCFSAGAALLGSAGQVNYSAANAFMDGLMQARRAAGLPGLSINWGAWAEVGMAAGVDDRTKAQWQASGIELISPVEGVALLFQLLPQAAAQVGVLPLNWAKLGQSWWWGGGTAVPP